VNLQNARSNYKDNVAYFKVLSSSTEENEENKERAFISRHMCSRFELGTSPVRSRKKRGDTHKYNVTSRYVRANVVIGEKYKHYIL